MASPMSDEQLLNLLIEADFGDGSVEACARLEQLLASDADARRRIGEFQAVWGLAGSLPPPAEQPAVPPAHQPRKLFAPVVGRAVAASLLFATVAIGTVAIFHSHGWQDDSFVVATSKAERRTVQLPDGSTAELSGDSALTVRFTDGSRNIRLERGQALFDVAHNAARPFIVSAGNGQIRALGTAFDVDLTRSRVVVTVTDGTVKVTTDGGRSTEPESTTLAVGQQVSYTPRRGSGGAMLSDAREVDVERVVGWTRGMLEFHGEPLHEVIDEVNRHAHARIVLLDPAEANTPVYGVLQAGDLNGLAKMLRDRAASRSSIASPVRIEQPIQ